MNNSGPSSRMREDEGAVGKRRGRGEALEIACARLHRLAQEAGPDARLPSMRTLCAEIGVNPGTLNLALDRLEQQRVLVRRERSGVFVAPRLGERNICLICSPAFFLQGGASPFWSLLLEKIGVAAGNFGARLTVVFSHSFSEEMHLEAGRDPAPLPPYLQDEIGTGNFHGVLSVGLPHPTTRWIEGRGVPVVAFAGAARFIVTTSGFSTIEQGVIGLAARGCRTIEIWLPPGSYWRKDRLLLEPRLSSLTREHGITDYAVIAPEPTAAERKGRFESGHIETGWENAFRRLNSGNVDSRPHGLLIADDMVTLGAMMAFPHLGLELQRDIQVATHANSGSPVLLGWQDRLIQIEFDLESLVAAMYETLKALMDYGPNATADGFVPPFSYDAPERANPETIAERFRIIRPCLRMPLA